jgi:hypothetical protein
MRASIAPQTAGGRLAQGAIGFGFPVIATPLLAMLMNIRTAIVLTVLPNMITGVVAIVRGGAGARAWLRIGASPPGSYPAHSAASSC